METSFLSPKRLYIRPVSLALLCNSTRIFRTTIATYKRKPISSPKGAWIFDIPTYLNIHCTAHPSPESNNTLPLQSRSFLTPLITPQKNPNFKSTPTSPKPYNNIKNPSPSSSPKSTTHPSPLLSETNPHHNDTPTLDRWLVSREASWTNKQTINQASKQGVRERGRQKNRYIYTQPAFATKAQIDVRGGGAGCDVGLVGLDGVDGISRMGGRKEGNGHGHGIRPTH